MNNVRVKFQEWTCTVEVRTYQNGNVYLQLWDEEGPVATATIGLDEKLPYGQAAIKDYSENRGMLKALKNAGLVKEVIGTRPAGFVTAQIVLLDLEKLGMPAEAPKKKGVKR